MPEFSLKGYLSYSDDISILHGSFRLFSCTFEQFYNFTKITVTAGGGEKFSSCFVIVANLPS